MNKGLATGAVVAIAVALGACTNGTSSHLSAATTSTTAATETSEAPPPATAPLTTTATVPPTTTTTASRPPGSAAAEAACTDYEQFVARWPSYLQDQVKATTAAEALDSAALQASQADPAAYHSLFVAADNFVAYVASTDWPQNGTPTASQPAAVESACAALG